MGTKVDYEMTMRDVGWVRRRNEQQSGQLTERRKRCCDPYMHVIRDLEELMMAAGQTLALEGGLGVIVVQIEIVEYDVAFVVRVYVEGFVEFAWMTFP